MSGRRDAANGPLPEWAQPIYIVQQPLSLAAHIIHRNCLAMQSFRASPWVSYEPSLSQQVGRDQEVSGSEDEDVDMDAPRISTLRDENFSQQPNKRPSKKRSHKAALLGDARKEAEEVDVEEDQLIDELIDDDDTARLSSSARSMDVAQKRKPSVRKSRKGEKKAGELEKKKPTAAIVPTVVPTISIFKANPTNSPEDVEMSASSAPMALAESSAPKAKKKASARKPAVVPRAMGKSAK